MPISASFPEQVLFETVTYMERLRALTDSELRTEIHDVLDRLQIWYCSNAIVDSTVIQLGAQTIALKRECDQRFHRAKLNQPKLQPHEGHLFIRIWSSQANKLAIPHLFPHW